MIENNWIIMGIMAATSTFALWAGVNTKIGKKIGTIVLALLLGMLFVNMNIIPAWSDAHGMVFSSFVPIAIALLLFQANLMKIFKIGPKMIIAFVLGAIGTLVGAFVASMIFDIGPENWKAYGVFAATYIGGSANLAGVGTGLDINPEILTTIGSADVIVFFLYILLLFNIINWRFITKRFPRYVKSNDDIVESNSESTDKVKVDKESNSMGIPIVLGVAVLITGIGEWLGQITGISSIIFITTFALILAATTNISKISVAEDLGTWLITIFFVAIGGTTMISEVINAGGTLLGGGATIVLVHLLIVLIGGWIAKVPIEYLLLASNANIGGPTTAAPMANMFGWRELVAPSLLLGVLGYAFGTYLGFSLAYFIRFLFGG